MRGDGLGRWPGARISEWLMAMEGWNGFYERTKDALLLLILILFQARFYMRAVFVGFETAISIKRHRHRLSNYIPEGLDCGTIPRLLVSSSIRQFPTGKLWKRESEKCTKGEPIQSKYVLDT
jgi:hypothetical protein